MNVSYLFEQLMSYPEASFSICGEYRYVFSCQLGKYYSCHRTVDEFFFDALVHMRAKEMNNADKS